MTPQRLHAELYYSDIIERYSPILLATVSAKKFANRQNMEKTSEASLSLEQRDILVGLLLGDGHLETRNNGQTYRLKVEHSDQQADYAQWLFKRFEHFCEQKNVYKRIRSDGRVSIGFTTAASDAFRFYAQQFYVAKTKRIPPLIQELLSPISLAIWFMDDGSRKSKKHKTYNIHTLGYTKSDLEFVQIALANKLGIQVALHKQ